MSLPLEPKRFLHITRAHRAIENPLHWVLDVTVNEDQAHNRLGNGPENLAILRRIALNLARAENSKGSGRKRWESGHHGVALDLSEFRFPPRSL